MEFLQESQIQVIGIAVAVAAIAAGAAYLYLSKKPKGLTFNLVSLF